MRASMFAIGPAFVFMLVACNRTPGSPAGEATSPAASGGAPQAEVAPPPATTAPTAIVYDCGDLQVTGSFGADSVNLSFTDSRALTLPRVPSGSGARYADDQGNQFFGKGPEAILTRPGEADRICSASEIGAPAAEDRR
jgi:membrane-bound inhibitor of C-type lysozyme